MVSKRIILACLLAVPLAAADKAPLHLAPSSKWVLDYGDNSCRLLRNFGENLDTTTLILERSTPRSPMSMLVLSNHFRAHDGDDPAKADFLPFDDVGSDEGMPAKAVGAHQSALLWLGISLGHKPRPNGTRPKLRVDPQVEAKARAERLAIAGQVTAIRVAKKSSTPMVLDTGSLGEVIGMLDQCVRDEVKAMGLDPAVQDKIVRLPRGNMTGWFRNVEYPKKYLAMGVSSNLELLMLVDETGKITGCTSLSHVDAPEFGEIACKAAQQRGHLEPAELADGTKVKSYTTLQMNFLSSN